MCKFLKRIERQSPQQLAADIAGLKHRTAVAKGRVS
jgi:hypothetical protein